MVDLPVQVGVGTCLRSFTSVVVREMCHDRYMNDRLCSERGALVGNTIVVVECSLKSGVAGIVGPCGIGRRHVATSPPSWFSVEVMTAQMRCAAKLRPPILFIAGAGVCLVATELAFL